MVRDLSIFEHPLKTNAKTFKHHNSHTMKSSLFCPQPCVDNFNHAFYRILYQFAA